MKNAIVACASGLALMLLTAGCAKNVAKVTPPSPPAPVAAARPAPVNRTPATTPSPTVASNRTTSDMPDTDTRARIQALLNRIEDVYFDYNRDNLRPDALAALKSDAHTLTEIIQQYPKFHLIVEGYCDDRGSESYNLALGDRRAKEAKAYLVDLGLPANQLQTVSYGKERPVCTEDTETCWQKNRRAHITQEPDTGAAG